MVPTITPPDARDGAGTSRSLRATHLWLLGAEFDLDDTAALDDPRALLLASVATGWTTEPPTNEQQPAGLDPPIERAFRELATHLGVTGDPLARETARRAVFRTGTPPHLVTSIDNGRNGVTVTAKGDVDAVLRCCTQLLDDQGRAVPLTREERLHLRRAVTRHPANGRRVVAVAHRAFGVGHPVPANRRQAETDLILIGLVAMADPLSAFIAKPPAPILHTPRSQPMQRMLRPGPPHLDDPHLHVRQPHDRRSGGVSGRRTALRAVVLSANAGIVSAAALMAGIAAATTNRTVLLTAGIAGLVAGALSWAGGAYLSVSARRDIHVASLDFQRVELTTPAEQELNEPAGIYVGTDLSEVLARQPATERTAHDALTAHAEAEPGIDPQTLTDAWHAAWVSTLAFASGALLPLLVILLTPAWKLESCAVAVAAALTATGVVSTRLGATPRAPAILRNIVVAAIAMTLTYAVGFAIRMLT